jgi:hypothetical protein
LNEKHIVKEQSRKTREYASLRYRKEEGKVLL